MCESLRTGYAILHIVYATPPMLHMVLEQFCVVHATFSPVWPRYRLPVSYRATDSRYRLVAKVKLVYGRSDAHGYSFSKAFIRLFTTFSNGQLSLLSFSLSLPSLSSRAYIAVQH